METLIVHTDSNEKLTALKAVLKALKIDFEKSPYDPHFVAKIKQGEKDFAQGNYTKINLDSDLISVTNKSFLLNANQ